MTPPSIRTRIVGHGLVQAAALIGFFWALHAGFTKGLGPIPAIASLLLMHIAYRAGEKVRAYKRWRAEWDALTPSPRSSRWGTGR